MKKRPPCFHSAPVPGLRLPPGFSTKQGKRRRKAACGQRRAGWPQLGDGPSGPKDARGLLGGQRGAFGTGVACVLAARRVSLVPRSVARPGAGAQSGGLGRVRKAAPEDAAALAVGAGRFLWSLFFGAADLFRSPVPLPAALRSWAVWRREPALPKQAVVGKRSHEVSKEEGEALPSCSRNLLSLRVGEWKHWIAHQAAAVARRDF